MVGIDLFDLSRKEIFDAQICQRFFWNSELEQIKNSENSCLLASKFFSVKESVYKLFHNLNPNLAFNKFRFLIQYRNFIFHVKYIFGNDQIINNFMKKFDFSKIYIADSDEKGLLVTVAIYQP